MTTRTSLTGVLALALALLSGCATRHAYSREAAANIKSLSVAGRVIDEGYDVIVVNHPGMAVGGLVGGAIVVTDQRVKTDRLTAALDPQQTQLGQRLLQHLVEALGTAGYEARSVPVVSNVGIDNMVEGLLPKVKTDALLTVAMRAGYVAENATTDYLPSVTVWVKAVKKDTGDVLYQDVITYGQHSNVASGIQLAAPADCRFPDMDALLMNPDKTRAGLVAGVDAIVAKLTSELTK